jgi:hypothetical protein
MRRFIPIAVLALGLVTIWVAILPLDREPILITSSPAVAGALFICHTQHDIDHMCAAALVKALIIEQPNRDPLAIVDRACQINSLAKEPGTHP